MKNEIINYLNLAEGKTIVDCTIGAAGHAEAILDIIGPNGFLLGIDCDTEALAIANEKLSGHKNVKLIHGNFREVADVFNNLGIRNIDGVMFDLGVSSMQLDNPGRGFSIRFDAPLDMRMDKTIPLSAYDLVNNLNEEELNSVLINFGQERWHNRIARRLVSERNKAPITTTKEFAAIILKAIPYRKEHWRIHPATRAFQALRIAVNQELDSLSSAIDNVIYFLKTGGRICIISFHSLEDRIVKEKFKYFAGKNVLKILTKKPLVPEEGEMQENPRSRSAKLRVAEKI